jgi:thioesterase domain-containing protein
MTRLSCRAVEHTVCEIWSGYFGRAVSPYDDFYELGGDSLAMLDIVVTARRYGLAVRGSQALRYPTPARLAECLTVGALDGTPGSLGVALPALYRPVPDGGHPPADSRPEPVRADGTGEPLYVVHSDSHRRAERDAVAGWRLDRPVRGLRLPVDPGAVRSGDPVGELAEDFLAAVRRDRPVGPYRLCGFGQGAVLAYELAARLRAGGADVASLVLVRPPANAAGEPSGDRDHLLRQRLAALAARFGLDGGEGVEQIHHAMRADGWYDDGVPARDLPGAQQVWVDLELAVRGYRFAGFDGPVVLVNDLADAGGGTEVALRRAVADLEVHHLDYGLEAPHAIVGAPELGPVVRKACSA